MEQAKTETKEIHANKNQISTQNGEYSMRNKARVTALKGMRCWWPSGQPPYITLTLTTLIIEVDPKIRTGG